MTRKFQALAILAGEAAQACFGLVIVVCVFPFLLLVFAVLCLVSLAGVDVPLKSLRWLRAGVAFPWAHLAHLSRGPDR